MGGGHLRLSDDDVLQEHGVDVDRFITQSYCRDTHLANPSVTDFNAQSSVEITNSSTIGTSGTSYDSLYTSSALNMSSRAMAAWAPRSDTGEEYLSSDISLNTYSYQRVEEHGATDPQSHATLALTVRRPHSDPNPLTKKDVETQIELESNPHGAVDSSEECVLKAVNRDPYSDDLVYNKFALGAISDNEFKEFLGLYVPMPE